MKRISRREFLKKMSLAAAGAYVGAATNTPAAGHMGGGMGPGGGGSGGSASVIDPPVGAAFQDPVVMPNVSTTPGLVEVNLTAQKAQIDVNGTMANFLTYNGHFPGPVIVAKNTDTLKINFTNSLPMSMETNILGHLRCITNLHTHGLHVSPTTNMDGTYADNVMVHFMPGEGAEYKYDLSKQAPGCLNFYHPHIHGTVAEQLWAGLVGGLVIEDGTDELSGFETHAMVIKDISLVGSDPAPHDSIMDFMHGLEGNTVMVNGLVNPKLVIRPGQVQRWRIVNASDARIYRLSLENHSLYLVGTDGGLLDKPYRLSEILLSPGERADVLVKASSTKGAYKFRSLPYNRGGMSSLQTITLLSLSCEGSKASDGIPSSINPEAARPNVDTSMLKKQNLILSMGQGKGYINGVSFVDHDHSYHLMSELGTYEVWEVSNQSGMDHPFHQHTNSVQVLSISGGDQNYASLYTSIPAWKDVVIIPKWGKATLLVPIMDYASDENGMPMVHCHIPEHEDIGMMAVWHIMDTSEPMPM
jgi:FtsP/CotA-like multicopper oxidase with cupredoxin domain